MDSEADIECYLKRRVRALGGEIRKVKWIARRYAPDRRVMIRGLCCCWVELKAPGEEPTAGQLREHRRMRDAGEHVEVIDSRIGVDELLDSAATNTGYQSAASVSGEHSVAMAIGYQSKAKACSGSWIVLAERDDEGGIISVRTAKAGADIKPDTYYSLIKGEFVEADDGEDG